MNYEIGSRNQGKFPNSYLLIPNFRRIAHRLEHGAYKLEVAGSTSLAYGRITGRSIWVIFHH